MTEARRANRGPKAAAGNRAALIAAAREVFAENGLDAPLSSIARAAAVGQGSLYRHFPTRESIVLAVFEDNIVEVEDLAARADSTLEAVLALIVAQITTSAAFIATLDPRTGDARLTAVSERLTSLLASKLEDAHRRGALGSWVDPTDVVLAVAMLAAVLAKTDEAVRPVLAERVWRVLWNGLGA
ncbi:helix-turn-helix domain-containing protein [Nocardia callitridis]|uniref:helix-turn-helix domain-containing protein n=1 Tax=Nocardia callitridis TaxID=648753 RepID=UPI0031E50DD5